MEKETLEKFQKLCLESPPFSDETAILQFDNQTVAAQRDTLFCPSKQTYAVLSEIGEFVKNGQKRPVGLKLVNGRPELCYIWDDGQYVHIDCLKETKEEFAKKYNQLKISLTQHVNTN